LYARRQTGAAVVYGGRRRLSERSPADDKNEFNHFYTPGRSLMDAVEASVRDCDSLAARLRRDADRVARGRALESERDVKQRLSADAESNLERCHSEYRQAQDCW